MPFYSLSLKIDGLHVIENFQISLIAPKQQGKREKNTLEMLYHITCGSNDIHLLLQNENKCACCDENNPEWLSLSLQTEDPSSQYIYDFKILLTHELIFSETLMLDETIIFKRNGSEISFPGKITDNFFERSDYLYLPTAKDEKTLKFRHLLEKNLAKALKNA